MDRHRDSDLQSLREWWSRLQALVPGDVVALWFGMSDLVADGKARRTLYVAGCPSFSPDDDTGEWATEYNWWPDDRYIVLPGLAEADDSLALSYAVDLVTQLRPQVGLDIEGVAAGFDDGDLVTVWRRATCLAESAHVGRTARTAA